MNEVLLKLILAFVLPFVFGMERQRSHKPAGFGTFTLVSVGACVLTIVTLETQIYNPGVLIGAIVTGIGFLGAGALIRNSDKIVGFVTATGIWLFAIFGIILGFGKYYEASIVYVLAWAVVLVDRHFERKGIGTYQRRVTITAKGISSEQPVSKIFSNLGLNYRIISMSLDKQENADFVFLVEGKKDYVHALSSKFAKEKWFDSISFE